MGNHHGCAADDEIMDHSQHGIPSTSPSPSLPLANPMYPDIDDDSSLAPPPPQSGTPAARRPLTKGSKPKYHDRRRVLEKKLDSILSHRAAISVMALLEQSDIPRGITSAEYPYPVMFVNQAWCNLCGYSAEEMLGRNLKCIQGEATNKAALNRMIRELTSDLEEAECTATTINYRKDGMPFHAKVTSIPLLPGSSADGIFGSNKHYVFKLEDLGLNYGHMLETAQERAVVDWLREEHCSTQWTLLAETREGSPKSEKKVHFKDMVSVILIPTRSEVEEAWTRYYTYE